MLLPFNCPIPKKSNYRLSCRDDVPCTINIIYEDIFGYKTDGFFVEVGAFDGEISSFTCHLADIGWTGHYIEPVEKYLLLCSRRHQKNKVSCHNFFIGNLVGKCKMYDYGPFSRKNIVTNNHPLIVKESGEIIDVNCITMDMFLKNNNIPREFDLLVIDVEDNEIDVLESFLSLGQEYSPAAIIIETTNSDEVKRIMSKSGYVRYCSLDTDGPFTKNEIYVSNKRANKEFAFLDELKERKLINLSEINISPIPIPKKTNYEVPCKDDVPSTINIIYEDIFGYKTDGFFIEVGAFDGSVSSFTCHLADIGWTGHYIEPIKKYLLQCSERHQKNKVSCHNLFIGNFVGVSTMRDYGPFSRQCITDNAFTKNESGELITIDCITMDIFLKNNNIPGEFDLLLIDVEDAEIDVLKSFLSLGKEYNPTAVIIETTNSDEVKRIMSKSGYVRYCSLSTDVSLTKNEIYVSNKRANEKFSFLDKLKKMKMINSSEIN